MAEILATTQTRVCKKCGDEKPLERFPLLNPKKSKWRGRRRSCQDCLNKKSLAWRQAHPEAHRAHRTRQNMRSRAIRKLFRSTGQDAGTLDAMRKALVEHPPELRSEDDTLAYFRGFMAGAKRSADEASRFERLKDLCHRIAAEKRAHYETRLSWAYEGLLAFMRKNPARGYQSEEAERRVAAQVIRSTLMDSLRREGPFKRLGTQRYETCAVTDIEREDQHLDALHPASEDDAPAEVEAIVARLDLPESHRIVLRALASGLNFRESGERAGLTESSACKIAKDVGEKYPELRQLLAS